MYSPGYYFLFSWLPIRFLPQVRVAQPGKDALVYVVVERSDADVDIQAVCLCRCQRGCRGEAFPCIDSSVVLDAEHPLLQVGQEGRRLVEFQRASLVPAPLVLDGLASRSRIAGLFIGATSPVQFVIDGLPRAAKLPGNPGDRPPGPKIGFQPDPLRLRHVVLVPSCHRQTPF